MDFSKLNPFRKTPTIYNFDNNWRPKLGIFTESTSLADSIEYICPDDFYALITNICIRLTVDISIGTSVFRGEIYRGSNEILALHFGIYNQIQPDIIAIYYQAAGFYNSGLASSEYLRHPLPPAFALIPGDKIQMTYITTKTNPRDFRGTVNLKAYYY